MFPGPGAQIHRNEAGEPIGWDYPEEDAMAYYCDTCGFSHSGSCPDPYDEDDISDEPSEDNTMRRDWERGIYERADAEDRASYNDMLLPGSYVLKDED